MIIKKFQGKTEAEAIENAKKELGNNLVVMNAKILKKKGFIHLFSKETHEVTVAMEEDIEKPIAKAAITKKLIEGQTPPETKTKLPAVVINEDNKQNEILRPILTKEDHSGKAIEEKLNNLQSFLEQQLQKNDRPEEENHQKEVGTKEEDKQITFLKLLYHTMLENEICEVYANQFIDEIEKLLKPNMTIDAILATVYQKIILKFEKPQTIEPGSKGPKLIYFVGPTGVGKTTTIAKIASRFRLDEKKKIALLTADTYRIAAAEQLRTYANILEVPFRIIYSNEEMELAFRDFREYDYIFIDTAGHSHKNCDQKEAMESFIHSLEQVAEKEVYLVLSATTKYRDLIDISNIYSKITEYKLIFTKLDETVTLGNLLNVKLHTKAPMSYVTHGQNVPDDLSVFNPQKTVKQLLGGKKES